MLHEEKKRARHDPDETEIEMPAICQPQLIDPEETQIELPTVTRSGTGDVRDDAAADLTNTAVRAEVKALIASHLFDPNFNIYIQEVGKIMNELQSEIATQIRNNSEKK